MSNNDKKVNFTDPEDITFFLDLPSTLDSFYPSKYKLLDNNTFTVFESIDKILYLIYSNNKNSIILYYLIDNKKICEIKNAHKYYITNLRHYLDKYDKKDLVISISVLDSNLKIWNINDLQCLLNLECYGDLFSSCLLYEDDQRYIITSGFKVNSIYVYDFNGIKIKEFENSKCSCVDTYFDKLSSKNFIIAANEGYVVSFYFKSNSLYQIYMNEYEDKYSPIVIQKSVVVTGDKNNIKLISSNAYADVLIWNFHSGELVKKIKVTNKICNIIGICLWNDDHLFLGCGDRSIKLINLNNGRVLKHLYKHFKEVLTIKKFFHPKYGECLISQGIGRDSIKLWAKALKQ